MSMFFNLFFNLILYPHSTPSSYTFIIRAFSSYSLIIGGKKYKHQCHMRQVQGISQQKGNSLSNAGYRVHMLKVWSC